MNKEISHKVTVIIPCYNEEEGIADVIKSFPVETLGNLGYSVEVVVVDNNSKDRTSEIARSLGATVLFEPKKGKGNAMRTGFEYVSSDTDYVVMLDGDNTYHSEEIMRLLEPLRSDFASVVIGSRLGGKIKIGSMKSTNRFGNRVFSRLVRTFYGAYVTDVLTGYFAWKNEALQKLRPHLISQGFAIEMEMVTKMARLDLSICSVPITYSARAGETNLRPFYDGSRILKMFFRNLRWKPVQQKKQKIAFVSDAVMPYHNGGKEKRLYEISKRLIDDKTEVHIYTMNWWGGSNTIVHEGVHFHAISKLYPLYSGERRSTKQAILFGLATLKLLFVKFDILDVDQIPFFPIFGARIVTWLRGKKLYVTWHEVWGKKYWNEYAKGMVGFLGNIIEQLSFLMPDVIISNSSYTTDRLNTAGVKKKIETVSLGVDLKHIFNAVPSKEKIDIIYVGRLLSHKNVDVLIKAIGIVKNYKPDIICKIVGTGPEYSTLVNLIEKLGLQKNIRISGSIESHTHLYGLMKVSKMLVLPSTREGFGLVVIEANAAGIPVITTSHADNAAQYLINEGLNGLLSETNEHSLSQKIFEILKNETVMKPQEGIEKYDWYQIVNTLKKSFTIL